MLPLLLALLLVSPTPKPESISDCAWAYQQIVDTGYFTDWPAYWEHCPDILPYFNTPEDKLHALFVVQCESGFDPLANQRRWGHLSGGKPQGLWSMMSHLRWDIRLTGHDIDELNTAAASWIASILVYETSSGWFHWWSCHRGFNHHLAKFGIRQVWYCPPPEYWANVPAGSNFRCGGKDYG